MQVAVIGPATATAAEEDAARLLGQAVAADGHVVVTGGRGGVMAAATAGAEAVGGVTLALLPGRRAGADGATAAAIATVVVPTGLGEARNALVVAAADVVVAVGGAWGTLSEVALAARAGTPVVVFDGWLLDDATARTGTDPLVRVATVDEAIDATRHLLADAA